MATCAYAAAQIPWEDVSAIEVCETATSLCKFDGGGLGVANADMIIYVTVNANTTDCNKVCNLIIITRGFQFNHIIIILVLLS